jgi:hypothetical protein
MEAALPKMDPVRLRHQIPFVVRFFYFFLDGQFFVVEILRDFVFEPLAEAQSGGVNFLVVRDQANIAVATGEFIKYSVFGHEQEYDGNEIGYKPRCG